MSQTSITFSVQVSQDASDPRRWGSPAFKLPGVRFLAGYKLGGTPAVGGALTDGALVMPSAEGDLTLAAIEVPDDLMLKSQLEEQRFALDQEKSRSEERSRRHTFLWSIGSALLTAAVTLGVAYLSKDGGSKAGGSGPAPDAVEACRASLKRLPLLAQATGQTVQGLAEAINRHEADCDEVLVKALGTR